VSPCSEGAVTASADDENAEIDAHGSESYAAWHLAIDPDAAEEPKAGTRSRTGTSRR
jgi:hypothetical protein